MKNSFQKFGCEGRRETMGSWSVMGVVRIESRILVDSEGTFLSTLEGK